MRILYNHRIQSRDGQSVHIEEMVTALRSAGHEVVVISPGAYVASSFGGESRLIALIRRVLPAFLTELAELFYNFGAWFRISRACRQFRPDLIYERYNLYYLAGALAARRYDILYYVEVNAPLADERARFSGLRLVHLARWAERFVWRAAHRVFAVTGVLKARIMEESVPEGRIEVTPNGVDLNRFSLRGPEDAERPLVLGFIGFVRAWHGVDDVIRGMAESGSNLLLRVVGEGPARAELETLAQSLGCSRRVQFLGLAEREAVPGLLAEFDIALQPRAVPYASPLKIFEFMAAGCAIVAPDQPNIREILEHERTALLFDPIAKGAMWQAIARLTSDPALRAALGHAARDEIIRRDLTWRGNASRVVAWANEDLTRQRDVF